MRQLIWVLLASAAPLVSPSTLAAQNIRLKFDPASSVALGSTLNVLNYGQALADCIDYQDDSLVFDTSGATTTTIRTTLASSQEEVISDLSRELKFTSKASGGMGAIGGEVDMDLSVKTTDYSKSADRSLVVGLTARAEYGRRFIRRYELKGAYKSLVTKKDWLNLREACGTHFVRAETRVSQLTVFITISNLDRLSKSTLVANFKNRSKATMKVSEVGGAAESTLTADLSSLVQMGKRVGSVTVDYSAVGGPGLSAAGQALKTADPENIAAIIDGLALASAGFAQGNSAPERFLLVPLSVFGIPAPSINFDRIQKLAKLKQHLADVQSQISVLEDYKGQNGGVFEKYFADGMTKLRAMEAALSATVETCTSKGLCEDGTQTPAVPFLWDVMTDPELELSCSYSEPVDRFDAKGTKVRVSYLQTATVNLTARVRFGDQLDLDASRVIRLNADTGEAENRTSAALNGVALSQADRFGVQRFFASIDFESFRQLSDQAQTSPSSQVLDQLSAQRQLMSRGMYLVELPTRLWLPKLTVAVGIPKASQCPTSRTARAN